ncbi:MAG: hypothetical protein Q7K65_03465 [Candidatus Buchananbacteria bacterium]|nr:hypothetical protein [Candidatus Buchananbacteria bacterium]
MKKIIIIIFFVVIFILVLLVFYFKLPSGVTGIKCDDAKYNYGNCPKGCEKSCVGSPIYDDAGNIVGETNDCNGPGSCSYPLYNSK